MKFDAKQISVDKAKKFGIRAAAGLGGAVLGHAVGAKTNLLVGLGLAATGMATGQPLFLDASIGCLVVVPPKQQVSGVDGIEGLKERLAAAKTGALSYSKSFLNNAGLTMIADKIPVSGIEGTDDGGYMEGFEQGYMAGIEESAGEEISGFYNSATLPLSTGNTLKMTTEAMMLSQMGV